MKSFINPHNNPIPPSNNNNNIKKELYDIEQLLSVGYISHLPYLANNHQELASLATHHLCPCCRKELSYTNLFHESINLTMSSTKVYSAIQQCNCGFDVPFHAIVNQLSPQQQKKTIAKKDDTSTQQARAHITLPTVTTNTSDNYSCLHHRNVEEINFQCRYLLHLALYDEAIVLIEQLTNHYPSHPLLPFYKAFALEKKGHHQKALQYYDTCLDLDVECEEAWHNKALILMQLNRTDEANYNLARYCRLQTLTGTNNETNLRNSIEASKILFSSNGLFGELRIMQNCTVRQLAINNEIEGSFWLENNEPSSIPAGDYTAGFLLAGCYTDADNVPTNGLMLGLGAGAGAIALLNNFDRLHLTVIEIDPTLIIAAIKYFPLLTHFIKTGRLTIICQDAIDYVSKMAIEFDFILIDLYQGDLSYPNQFRGKNFLNKLARSSKLIGINLIQPKTWQQYQQVIKDFKSAGIILKSCLPTGIHGTCEVPYQNRVLFSEVVDNVTNFMPYDHLQVSYLQLSFRRDFMNMVLRCESINEHKDLNLITTSTSPATH